MTLHLFQAASSDVARDDPTCPLSGLQINGSASEGEGDKRLCGKRRRTEGEEEEIPLKRKEVAADEDGVNDRSNRIPPGAKPDGPTQNRAVNVKDVQKVFKCFHSRTRTLKARRNQDTDVESKETADGILRGPDRDVTEPRVGSRKSPLTSEGVDRNHNHILSPIKPRERKLTKENTNVSAEEDILSAGGQLGPSLLCVPRRRGQTDRDQEPEPPQNSGGKVGREVLPGSLLSYFIFFKYFGQNAASERFES